MAPVRERVVVAKVLAGALAGVALAAFAGVVAWVLAALSRIDENSYGKCVDCGHEIPEGRLDARPDAARCVGCQSKWAKRHR